MEIQTLAHNPPFLIEFDYLHMVFLSLHLRTIHVEIDLLLFDKKKFSP